MLLGLGDGAVDGTISPGALLSIIIFNERFVVVVELRSFFRGALALGGSFSTASSGSGITKTGMPSSNWNDTDATDVDSFAFCGEERFVLGVDGFTFGPAGFFLGVDGFVLAVDGFAFAFGGLRLAGSSIPIQFGL